MFGGLLLSSRKASASPQKDALPESPPPVTPEPQPAPPSPVAPPPQPAPPTPIAPQPQSAPSTPVAPPAPQPKPPEPNAPAEELLNAAQPDAPKFSWTLASVALEGEVDTYNTEAERKARKLRLAAQPGAKLVNTFQQLVYFIANLAYPGAGAALQAIFSLATELSANLNSRGGREDWPSLTRKRILLTGNLPVEAHLPPGMVTVQNRYQYRDARTTAHYQKLMRWYRANLEMQRIVSTPDEAMMPVVYVAFLRAENLWPPPIEPIALSSAEARSQYSKFPTVLNWIALNPIESYVSDQATAAQAYESAMSKYRAQTPDYRDLVVTLSLPPEVAEVMGKYGSWPRAGSPFFPVQLNGAAGQAL